MRSPRVVKRLIRNQSFTRKVREYRDRIGATEGRPQTASRFVQAVTEMVERLMENPGRGHNAGFASPKLKDVLRISVPGYKVFAIFYRWDGQVLTLITLEHTSQDLAARLERIN